MLDFAVVVLVLPTIWIVDANNGPGANFIDLPAAVAAAQSGDTILVRAGTYTAFYVAGKTLTIRGAGASTTIIDLPTGVPGYSHTTINATPSGGNVYLSGLSIKAMATGSSAAALNVTAGATVVIADCTVTGVEVTNQGRIALQVADGAVHASRCTFSGGTTSPAGFPQFGMAGVYLQGATFAADACTFFGGSALYSFSFTGGNGLTVSNSTATLFRCQFRGGSVRKIIGSSTGGHGIAAINTSFVRLATGQANTPVLAMFGTAAAFPFPLSLLGIPTPGCQCHLDPLAGILMLPTIFEAEVHPAGFGATAELLVKIPAVPAVFGFQMTTQWFDLLQLATSNAITWTVATAIPSLDMALVEGHPSGATGTVSTYLAHVMRFDYQ